MIVNEPHDSSIHQLVLVRGLARESRHWGAFIQDLEEAYANRGLTVRIELLDLPGCGRHSEMRAPLTVDETADFLREKLKEILVREAAEGLLPATHRRLVSISLGGMVGSSWLARYPTDFHSAILMNSSFRGISSAARRLRWQEWWRIPGILGAKEMQVRERRILDWVSNRPEKREAALAEWIAIQNSRPVSNLNLAIQLSTAMRYESPPRIATPILVVTCQNDRMVSHECSRAIAKTYNAELRIHPTAGHDVTLDDGPWVASIIAEWKSRTV
jgi:pimeloyl-ACP methyl ester carboxylesterase